MPLQAILRYYRYRTKHRQCQKKQRHTRADFCLGKGRGSYCTEGWMASSPGMHGKRIPQQVFSQLVACGCTDFAIPVKHIYKTIYKCKELAETALNTITKIFLVTKHDSFQADIGLINIQRSANWSSQNPHNSHVNFSKKFTFKLHWKLHVK